MKQSIRINLAWLAPLFLLGWFCGQTSAQTVAFTNATVETLTDQGRLENATVIVRAGRIVEVGTDIQIPDEARVISLAEKTLIPGIIDPYLIFRRAAAGGNETEEVTFGGRTFQIPRTRSFNPGSFDTISQNFYPQTFDFSRYIRSGVTNANLVSDGRGISAISEMVVEPSPEMLVEEKALLFSRLTNETAALDLIRTQLAPRPAQSAGRGGANRGAAAAATASQASGQRPSSTGQDNQSATSAAATSGNDYWSEVRDGKKYLIINANNAATVAHLLKILEKHPKVKVALVTTGPNVYQALDRVQGTNISLILKPEIATEPFSARRINVPKMAAERNIPFAFSVSVSPSQLDGSMDEPLFPLAALVKAGLDRDKALAALSATPAKILGIDQDYGKIAAGQYANFLIFDGDPLTTGNRLEQVIVRGSSIYEN